MWRLFGDRIHVCAHLLFTMLSSVPGSALHDGTRLPRRSHVHGGGTPLNTSPWLRLFGQVSLLASIAICRSIFDFSFEVSTPMCQICRQNDKAARQSKLGVAPRRLAPVQSMFRVRDCCSHQIGRNAANPARPLQSPKRRPISFSEVGAGSHSVSK